MYIYIYYIVLSVIRVTQTPHAPRAIIILSKNELADTILRLKIFNRHFQFLKSMSTKFYLSHAFLFKRVRNQALRTEYQKIVFFVCVFFRDIMFCERFVACAWISLLKPRQTFRTVFHARRIVHYNTSAQSRRSSDEWSLSAERSKGDKKPLPTALAECFLKENW